VPSYDVRNAKTLGAALRHARTQHGYTQDELAEQLDITRNYINEMETGKPNLWSTRMFRALRFLKVKITVSFDAGPDAPRQQDQARPSRPRLTALNVGSTTKKSDIE
jgi:transcriptional regulator with XRE-family HTH domain